MLINGKPASLPSVCIKVGQNDHKQLFDSCWMLQKMVTSLLYYFIRTVSAVCLIYIVNTILIKGVQSRQL